MLFKVKSHTSSSVRLNVLAIIEYSSDKVMENTPLSSVCKVMCKKMSMHFILSAKLFQSCSILPHSYGPLRAIDGSYGLYKLSALPTVCILSTYEASISLLHQGSVFYGLYDPYDP